MKTKSAAELLFTETRQSKERAAFLLFLGSGCFLICRVIYFCIATERSTEHFCRHEERR